MVKTNALEYLEKHGKVAAYICGDRTAKTCGLNEKLVDLRGCEKCYFKKGELGIGDIKKRAKIYYHEGGFLKI